MPRRARQSASRAVWLRYALAVAAYTVLFALWQLQPDPVPIGARVADTALAAVCMFPIACWYAGGQRGLPMFEIICLSFGVQYALPLYLQPNQANLAGGPTQLPWPATEQALLLATLGMTCMVGAFFAVRRSPIARRVPRVTLPLADAALSRYLCFAFVLGVGATFLVDVHLMPSNDGPLGGVIRIITYQAIVGLALLAFWVYGAERCSTGWVYFLYVWTAALVALGLTTGVFENAVVPAAVVVLVRWQTSGRLPWRLLLVGTMSFLILQPIKQEYRAQTWGAQQISLGGRLALWAQDGWDLVQTASSGDIARNAQTVSIASTGRLDLLHQFAVVDALTPSSVPYAQGQTYAYLGYSLVPRFLWPEKPSTQQATDFLALSYGFLPPNLIGQVSIGLGWMAEAFANFGTLGVILIMALQGVMYAVLDLSLNGPESQGGRGLYLAQMIFFLNGIGTTTAIILGGILQAMLPTMLLLRVAGVRGASRARVRRPATAAVGMARGPVNMEQR